MSHEPRLRSTGQIAVVDDDPSVRRALARVLQSSSYDVKTFETARDFIADLTYGLPACVLIDLHMPNMTGLELQSHLTGMGVDLPTIVMTAHDEVGTRERCLAAGASAYLVKPLREAILVAAIKAATEGPAPN